MDQFEAREALKKEIAKYMEENTDYRASNDSYDDYILWLYNKDEANAMADDLAFSAQISGDGTRVVSLDFCLSDIFGDGPASSAHTRKQLDTFLKAVKAISKYLPEQVKKALPVAMVRLSEYHYVDILFFVAQLTIT